MAAPMLELKMDATILNSSMGAAMLPETRDLVRFWRWIKMAATFGAAPDCTKTILLLYHAVAIPRSYLSRQIFYTVLKNYHSHLWWIELTSTLAKCQFKVLLMTVDNIKKEMLIPHRLLPRPTSKPLWRCKPFLYFVLLRKTEYIVIA